MNLVRQHLDVLLRLPLQSQGPVGANLRSWAASLRPSLPIAMLEQLPETDLCRDRLRIFCAKADISVTFLAVAAWGGMHRLHASRAWQARANWGVALESLRSSNRTRGEDFAILHELQLAKMFPGVGAPYFTKLLFFLRPKSDAYIMDQWTAKSVNLLTGQDVVKISPAGWVGPENSQERYEEFCCIVDELARRLGCTGSEAEHALISKGGRHPWKWREYVKANFPSRPQKR